MRKSVLLVDDSPRTRQALRKSFEMQSSFEICGEAESGIEAVQKAQDLKPDLVVLDFSLPQMNGVEVARRLRAAPSSIQIILFTWHADALPTHFASNLGMTVVPKGSMGTVLVRAASALVEQTEETRNPTSEHRWTDSRLPLATLRNPLVP
jgi:DNA-binding NarL/FixJ family response regulator